MRERARKGERERVSLQLIWPLHLKYELIYDVSVHFILVTSSDKFWGVYLTAYLGTSSENLNSHLILVTSSDIFWGEIVKLPFLTTRCQ